jgi:hypothetical protein
MRPQLNGGTLGGQRNDPTMKIVDAMTLRDGGTTCVTVDDAGTTIHVTAAHDFRLFGWLPTLRFVFISSRRFGRDRRLLPGGPLEKRYVSEIADAAVAHLGYDEVRDFLGGNGQNPGQQHWFYVANFLRIVNRARLRNVLGSAKP